MDSWQDISTAPRSEDEEVWMLLYSPDDGICIGAWDLNTDFRHVPGGWPLTPTHWQPLPAPPGR